MVDNSVPWKEHEAALERISDLTKRLEGWMPIETAPFGFVLLWCVPENNPKAAGVIVGQVARQQPSEYWTAVPTVIKHLSDDAPVADGCIWDGNVYRPMRATHWMPLPEGPLLSRERASERQLARDPLADNPADGDKNAP